MGWLEDTEMPAVDGQDRRDIQPLGHRYNTGVTKSMFWSSYLRRISAERR